VLLLFGLSIRLQQKEQSNMRNLRKFIAVASIAATGVLATGGVASAESASGSGATATT
jgi:hypothetical protein